MQRPSQKINGKVNLQEANLLENGCYHCNMYLKIGHGHEERQRKESYVVLSPKSTHILLYILVEKNKSAIIGYF